jgi:hypothetical protein
VLADTICLHLSNIDTEEQSFAEYVHWLQSQDETVGSVFKFENVLKYARFPDLHTQMPRHSDDLVANLRQDHDEIKIVIDWLKKRKSPATQILELSVPDRLFSPHSDDIVSDCINGLGVRTLNWRKLDLYLADLKDRDDLEELHLYSSGNKSVHEQWYKELPSFTKVGSPKHQRGEFFSRRASDTHVTTDSICSTSLYHKYLLLTEKFSYNDYMYMLS